MVIVRFVDEQMVNLVDKSYRIFRLARLALMPTLSRNEQSLSLGQSVRMPNRDDDHLASAGSELSGHPGKALLRARVPPSPKKLLMKAPTQLNPCESEDEYYGERQGTEGRQEHRRPSHCP